MGHNPQIKENPGATFGRFIPACAARGIAKSKAYELADAGLLPTFKIGRARYIKIEVLDSLPDRLAANDAEASKENAA